MQPTPRDAHPLNMHARPSASVTPGITTAALSPSGIKPDLRQHGLDIRLPSTPRTPSTKLISKSSATGVVRGNRSFQQFPLKDRSQRRSGSVIDHATGGDREGLFHRTHMDRGYQNGHYCHPKAGNHYSRTSATMAWSWSRL
ncbi:hypothetical protein LshimejAT787_0601790 [Lyophyllum shimeji]|uniref:Uncharacterized protein n=1 Tax=Lyophyllum shimeji TaxID=47721 RepID=A0A9P3PPH7_LYOSH|nr:hypothetical protein LshimejAT787_0601790 [Lyophyllum shimeji]